MLRGQKTHMHILFRQLPIMVVLLAAFVFSASNGLKPLFAADVEQVQSPFGADEEDNRPVSYVDYASSALVPVAQLSFLHQTVFKVVVLPVVVVQEKPRVLPPIRAEEFLKTLFTRIISPNAP